MRYLRSASRAASRLRAVHLLLLCCAIIVPVAATQAAPKTDVVYFTNGDRLTGEIKGLEKGKLELSTSTAGTVDIEWDKIARIETDQYLRVEMSSGARFHGRVPQDQQPGSIRLAAPGEAAAQPLAMADVVRIAPIQYGSLVDRLDGYLTVGFSYAKADSRTDFDFSGGLSSRNEIREWTLDGQTTVNAQSNASTTSMYDVTLANKRFMQDRWFQAYFGTVQGNEELGLNIREVLGAGIGRYLAQDMHHEWFVVAGLAYDREDFESQPTQDSLEGVAVDPVFVLSLRHAEALDRCGARGVPESHGVGTRPCRGGHRLADRARRGLLLRHEASTAATTARLTRKRRPTSTTG